MEAAACSPDPAGTDSHQWISAWKSGANVTSGGLWDNSLAVKGQECTALGFGGTELCLLCLLCFGRVLISLSQWSCSRWCKISLGRVCWLFRKTANRKFGWCGPHCLLCMGEHRTGFLFGYYLVPIYLFPIHCKDAAKDRKCSQISTLMTGNFWRAAEWWSVGAAWGAQCLARSGCPSANSSFCLSMADQSQELWMLYNYNPISSWYLLKQVCVINAACLEAVPALLISPQGFLFSFLGFS